MVVWETIYEGDHLLGGLWESAVLILTDGDAVACKPFYLQSGVNRLSMITVHVSILIPLMYHCRLSMELFEASHSATQGFEFCICYNMDIYEGKLVTTRLFFWSGGQVDSI